MICWVCLCLDSACECVFYCSDCAARGVDTMMVKDEINGGHLCPVHDAAPSQHTPPAEPHVEAQEGGA